jgi:hypothetical protein
MPANTASTSSYETVIDTIRAWPASTRFALVQDVLATLAPEEHLASVRQPTLPHALGLLRGSGIAPTDAEVRNLLDSRLNERFGS